MPSGLSQSEGQSQPLTVSQEVGLKGRQMAKRWPRRLKQPSYLFAQQRDDQHSDHVVAPHTGGGGGNACISNESDVGGGGGGRDEYDSESHHPGHSHSLLSTHAFADSGLHMANWRPTRRRQESPGD